MMIKVFIVDDHAVVRQGLKQILAEESRMTVVGEAANGVEAPRKIQETNPDVVILDISLPGRNGIDVLRRIKADAPNRPVLVLSMYPEDQYAVRLLKDGAAGYLTKESRRNNWSRRSARWRAERNTSARLWRNSC